MRANARLFTILRHIWLNQLRQRQTGPDLIELDADENDANKPADIAQYPHIGYVNTSSMSKCGQRSSNSLARKEFVVA